MDKGKLIQKVEEIRDQMIKEAWADIDDFSAEIAQANLEDFAKAMIDYIKNYGKEGK